MKALIRGNIYYGELKGLEGSVQSGIRPLLVVSNDIGNMHSKVVIVVPITSRKKKPLPTHVHLGMDKPSTALCEQIQTVSKSSISGAPIYSLTEDELKQIDNALDISLGIER